MIQLIKKSFVLTAPVFAGIIGLLIFSFTFQPQDSLSKTKSRKENKFSTHQDNQFHLSEQFLDIEYQINQTKIDDKQKLESQISTLGTFQKGYLSAILNRRSGEYQEAYKLLTNLLDQNVLYYPYYEELADLANTTGNLDELDKLVEDKLSDNFNLNFLKGIISYKRGNYNDAVKSFESLISQTRESKEIYFWLSYFYRGEGNYDRAFELLDKADSLTNNEDIYHCKITLAKGSLYYFSGDYDNAEIFYQLGYEEAKSSGNRIEEIRGLANLAIILDESGEVEAARKNLTTAIDMTNPIENTDMLAYLYSELGVSFTYTNDIIDARNNYEASYKSYLKLNNRERLSYLSTNIGSIYLQLTNYREALNYYQQAYDFAGENILGRILSLTGSADVYTNMANYSKALMYYHKAGDLADSIKDVSSKAKVDVGLGTLFLNINKPKSSLKYYSEAEKLLNPEEFPYDASDIYYRLGIVKTSLKDYVSAESYFNKGLDISEKYDDIYTNLAIKTEYAFNLYQQNKNTEAKKMLIEAEGKSNNYQLDQLVGLQNLYLGEILVSEKQNALAIGKFKIAYNKGATVNDLNTRIEAAYSLAELFKGIDKKGDAESWYKKAIKIIETAAVPLFENQDVHIALFSGFNKIYNSFVEFYLENDRQKEALNILERSRSRNTLQNLVTLKLFSSKEDKENLNKYLDLKWMIKSGLFDESKIDSLQREVSNFEFVFKKNNIRNLSFSDPALSVDSIEANIDANEWIISIYTSADYTQVFTIGKYNFESKRINISRDSLLTLISDITPVFNSTSLANEIYVNEDLFSFNAKFAYELYKTLFKDTFDKIANDQKIIFSLPPELLNVPLEFLITSWDDSQSSFYYQDKHFLIEKYPISYTPSASIYIEQEEIKPTYLTQVLLLGDPDISNDEFTTNYRSGLLEDDSFTSRNVKLFPLEFSRSEIESIEKLLDNNLVLLSGDATETNFKKNASNSKIIHLSSHSFLYKDQPLILLSREDDKENDGFLEMGEIVNMNLKSDLVVLSSCRSGLGKVDNSEGIIGMQKSFFDAGASSIMVSLWDVNDKYTSFLMSSFYKYLSEGFDKNQALRKAKLSFMKNYSPNPYFWSAFVLSGNISSVRLEESKSYLIYYAAAIIILLYFVYSLGLKKRKKIIST